MMSTVALEAAKCVAPTSLKRRPIAMVPEVVAIAVKVFGTDVIAVVAVVRLPASVDIVAEAEAVAPAPAAALMAAIVVAAAAAAAASAVVVVVVVVIAKSLL